MVNTRLGVLHEEAIFRYPTGQFGHGGSGSPYALVHICAVKAQVHGDGGARMSELSYHLEGVVVDLNGRRLTDICCTDIGLFDTDGEVKVFA